MKKNAAVLAAICGPRGVVDGSGPCHGGLPRLDRLALLYLAAPVLLFLVGWLEWWIGLAAAALLLTSVLSAGRSGGSVASGLQVTPAVGCLAVCVAVAWTCLGGAGHWFFANFDWYTRDAVLRDLVVGEWPVAYQRTNDAQVVLRAPIAYYLPAAVAGKLIGLGVADLALFAWTALGVTLFLLMAVSGTKSLAQATVILTVMVFFSGMDLLGTLLRYGPVVVAQMTPVEHLEWWAQRYQYSSHTTQLFWVPNHAMPGWLATMMLLRNADRLAFIRILPVLVAVLPLWSPLTALGFLPFAVVASLAYVSRAPIRDCLDARALPAAAILVALTGLYLTVGSGDIASGNTRIEGEPWWYYVPHYVQFVLLEGGILWFLLLFVRRDAFLWTAGAVLLVLPALWFGPGNDLAMRGSIPALVVLAFAAARVLANGRSVTDSRVYWAIAATLVLGIPTAATEISRAVIETPWKPDLSKNLVAVSGGQFPPHYVASVDGHLVSTLLRPPSVIDRRQPVPAHGAEEDR